MMLTSQSSSVRTLCAGSGGILAVAGKRVGRGHLFLTPIVASHICATHATPGFQQNRCGRYQIATVRRAFHNCPPLSSSQSTRDTGPSSALQQQMMEERKQREQQLQQLKHLQEQKAMYAQQQHQQQQQQQHQHGVGTDVNGSSSGKADSKGGAPQLPAVVEITPTNIMSVLSPSNTVPILLDCYADWCGPCKQLTPVLEELVKDLEKKNHGKPQIILAKLNVDDMPEIAQQLGVSGIPAVFAILSGRVLNSFSGALSAGKVQQFVQQAFSGLLHEGTADINYLLSKGRSAFEEANYDEAISIFKQIQANKEWIRHHASALTGLANVYLAQGDIKEARKIVDELKQSFPKSLTDPEVESMLNTFNIANEAAKVAGGSLTELEEKVRQNPSDIKTSYDLMVMRFASNQQEKAFEQALDLVKKNREWNDRATEKFLLQAFGTLGSKHPLTQKYRRKLANVLVV